MSSTEHYLALCRQGRETFLQGVAPAALVRRGVRPLRGRLRPGDDGDDSTVVLAVRSRTPTRPPQPELDLEIYPLEKKPGAPFSDMITVGRTANNDVVLDDVTVSRFHAYFRGSDDSWRVCDSGSKNGSKLDDQPLAKRKETAVRPGQRVVFGEVELVLFSAAGLYDLLLGVS